MELANAGGTQPGDLFVDVVASRVRVADIVEDFYGRRGCPIQNSGIFLGGIRVLDAENDASALSPGTEVTQEIGDIIHFSARLQGAVTKEGEEHVANSHLAIDFDSAEEPLLAQGVALEAVDVEDIEAGRDQLQFKGTRTGKIGGVETVVVEGEFAIDRPAPQGDLNTSKAEAGGQVDGIRIPREGEIPIGHTDLKVAVWGSSGKRCG